MLDRGLHAQLNGSMGAFRLELELALANGPMPRPAG